MSVERRGGSILIVEDDPQIAAILTDLLASEGYEVATESDGAALPLAFRQRPNLILLDVMMPGMDGVEVCRRLNADPRTSATPIVFLTAMPTEVLLPRLAGCRYLGIIRKPFGLNEILTTVHDQVGED